MRSCLVLTNGSYFGFICPVISKESQNCRIKNTTTAQIIENRLNENPIGSMKFETVGICVLKMKCYSMSFILRYQQPDGVEGHFLVGSQNVVTKFPADKINYFQDGDND